MDRFFLYELGALIMGNSARQCPLYSADVAVTELAGLRLSPQNRIALFTLRSHFFLDG